MSRQGLPDLINKTGHAPPALSSKRLPTARLSEHGLRDSDDQMYPPLRSRQNVAGERLATDKGQSSVNGAEMCSLPCRCPSLMGRGRTRKADYCQNLKRKAKMTSTARALCGNPSNVITVKDKPDEPATLKHIGGSPSDEWNNVLIGQVADCLWLKNSSSELRKPGPRLPR
jgi:hypothetical protein